MSHLNLVIPLEEFILFSKDILEKNNAFFYIENRNDQNLINKVLFTEDNLENLLQNYSGKNLNFFISTKQMEDLSKNFYDDIAEFIIVGEGGRVNNNFIERISLRLLSKEPEKTIKKIFGDIKNKLKKDENFGMGVKGNSALHKNYFYLKKNVGLKPFISDIHNEKSAIIEV